MDKENLLKGSSSNEVKLLSADSCYAFIITYRLNVITLTLGDYKELHQVYDGRYSVIEEVDDSDFEFSFRKAVSKWVFQNGSYNE